jgi:hypothetical protein
MVLPQEPATTALLAGTGAALIGAGLIVGALNYLLGRAIFRGIANLSGRIRHKRVKIRREAFNYSYAYADEAAGAYGAGGSNGAYGAGGSYGANETSEGKDGNHEQQD